MRAGPENAPSAIGTINFCPKGVSPMSRGVPKVRFALNSNFREGGTGAPLATAHENPEAARQRREGSKICMVPAGKIIDADCDR